MNLGLEWAKVNLDEQLVCNPDLGCGLVAGWGPSGKGARPGFGWFFGGDAAINSLAMSSAGMSDLVGQGLRFLAKYQRDDGKITHEISQAAGRIPWFTDFPYAYYHADTTPFWIVAVWRHVRATGDRALLQELWPRVQKAFAWCKGHDSDGDGIIENTTAGLGAIEVGDIGRDLHQDIYLACRVDRVAGRDAATRDTVRRRGHRARGRRVAAPRGRLAGLEVLVAGGRPSRVRPAEVGRHERRADGVARDGRGLRPAGGGAREADAGAASPRPC